ncbi:ankyrin repeat-containing domain protein [Mycena rebaudengoi]|nr:ankyrin repeat-containing domain protein [Mycena rebaudengoi]
MMPPALCSTDLTASPLSGATENHLLAGLKLPAIACNAEHIALQLFPFALDFMDPVIAVGLVASILQLVAAAKSVLDLGRDALNATKDQRDLLFEIASLAPLLEDLEHRVQQPNNQSSNGIQKLETPLGQLKETMEHINRKLGSANKVGSKTLVWALWSKKEVDADLAKIERFKTALNAWLLLDNWDVGQQIRTELGTISQNQREYHDGYSSNMQRQDIDRTLKEVRNVVQNQQDLQNSAERESIVKEREKIFDWLSPPNFFVRHAEIFGTRQKGTGLWFLDKRQFKDWLSSLGGTLWCRGIPGAGKTVLMSIVVDYLRSHLQSNNVGVAVAYLNHKESDAHSPSNILAGLWWQLVLDRPISAFIQKLYRKHQKQRTRPSLDEVREILRSTIAEYSKVFMVVDALDEYPEAQRRILLDALGAMGESVSLMLTSRPNIAPESFSPSASVVKIHAKDEDIRCYVKAQIQSSFRLSKHAKARPELHEEIETKIAQNADGMFLIAKLHIDSLATKSTVKAVRAALQNLPQDLEQTYDEAMERINAQNKEDRKIARRTLIWVANAKRPLTVFQLQEALAVDLDSKALDVDGLLDIEIIVSVCVGLVIIDASQSRSFLFNPSPGHRIVRLVHLTIQDYFDRVQPIHFPEAQTEITRTCLTYISYNNDVPKNLYQQPGLLSYASSYCLLHAAGEPELVLKDGIIQFLGDAHRWRDFPTRETPLQWSYRKWPQAPSSFWVAALFGLEEITRHLLHSDKSINEEEKEGSLIVALEWNCLGVVRLLIKHGTNGNTQQPFIGNALQVVSEAGYSRAVQLLLENGADVNLQGCCHGTALQAASVEGHTEVVQLLLKHGADVNTQGGKYETPLQAASRRGSSQVVQLLLKNGADVDLLGGKYGTALQAASQWENMEVVKLLIENGADVNIQGGYWGTALQAASQWGSMEVVQLLLENSADVNLQGGYFGTALQAASNEGSVELVQLLLKHGANINMQGGKYRTALQAASAKGEEGVVQLLLEHGADVNVKGGEYGTALQAALESGNVDVVWLLLDHNADVNTQGGEYGTPLHAALAKGYVELTELLLEHGADPNLQGGTYGTALQAASWCGRMNVMRMLLVHGADVNAQGGEYGTALQAASAEGTLDVVQLLLEHGANVNGQDGQGFRGEYGTALQAASRNGNMKVVQMLLEHGADMDLQGGYYGTALQAASWLGNMEVVQLLLENGADVNAQGGVYGTALQAASAKPWEGVVRLLLEHGADVNMQGGYFGTALQAASGKGHTEIVRLLLKHGADVNTQGGEYGTALQAASWCGCMEVIQLLLGNDPDVDLQGGYYGTAVSTKGPVAVVQPLENGADVNLCGGGYGTASQAASSRGSTEVVQLILKHCADVNARGGKYGTAYRAAKSRGRTEVTEFLIAHGADMDLTAEPGS